MYGKFCSNICQSRYWRSQYHSSKKKKIWQQKLEIIRLLGGKCTKCDEVDIRVLDINHIDRSKKIRPEKGRYTWSFRLKEWKDNMSNIELLCANCHRKHTWEQMKYCKIAQERLDSTPTPMF